MITHARKLGETVLVGDGARAARHEEALRRHHRPFNSLLTAVNRTELRLGLSHKPDENDLQRPMVQEFHRLNDSMTEVVDIMKSSTGIEAEKDLDIIPACSSSSSRGDDSPARRPLGGGVIADSESDVAPPAKRKCAVTPARKSIKAPSAIAALQAAGADGLPKRKLPFRGTSVAASPSKGKLPRAIKDAPQSISSREDSSSLPEINAEKRYSEEGSSVDDDKLRAANMGILFPGRRAMIPKKMVSFWCAPSGRKDRLLHL